MTTTKTYKELNEEMLQLLSEMEQAKKNERHNALKEARSLCKQYAITTAMLKGAMSKGRKRGRKQAM